MILFYSYAHEDDGLRAELDTHLSSLKREGVLESWSDREITPGSDWRTVIQSKLGKADVILFLISADFLASDYCYSVEVQGALTRHKTGSATVVPVILRACDWQNSLFAGLQHLPDDGIPVTSWPNRDEAWTNVAQGIRRALDDKIAISKEQAPEILPGSPTDDATDLPQRGALGQVANRGAAKDLAEAFLKTLKKNPYAAASFILFFALNALIGALDTLLSILSKLGFPQNPTAAPKSYALLLATAGTLLSLAYHGVVTAMKSPSRDGGIRRPAIPFLDRFFGHSLKYEVFPIVSCCVLLNIAGAFMALSAWNLIFLDTIGTLLGAVLLGPYWGATIGLATNVCTANLFNSNAFLWAGVNALLGLSWGYASRYLKLYERLVPSPFKAITPLRMLGFFVLPAIFISSWASTVIKVSIYDPRTVRLFYESSWVVPRYFLHLLESRMSTSAAYFIGDLARNTCDKLIVVLVGMLFLLGRSVSLGRSREVLEPHGRRLPILDIGTGQAIIFSLLYLVALFEMLPFEYVYDRQSDSARSITLNLLSWVFLSLPLYVTIIHLLFSQAGYVGMEERDRQRRSREALYKKQISMARNNGLLSWVRSLSIVLLVVVISYFLTLRLALAFADSSHFQKLATSSSSQQPATSSPSQKPATSSASKLTEHQSGIALGAIAAGLCAGLVLWLLFAIEETAEVDRAGQ